MTERLDREQFLAGYLAEVEDHIRGATSNLLALDAAVRAGRPQARALRELFRALHTIKGLSAMVDVEPVVELAHAMEALLRAADQGGGRLDAPAIERLLQGVTAIEARVKAVAARQPVAAAPPELLEAIAGLSLGAPRVAAPPGALQLEPALLAKLAPGEVEQLTAPGDGRRAVRLDFTPSPERAARGLTITSVREALGRLGELVKVLPRAVPDAPGSLVFSLLLVTAADPAALGAAVGGGPGEARDLAPPPVEASPPALEAFDEDEPAPAAGRIRHQVVRVSVERLDDALDKLAALIVSRFRLERVILAHRERGVDVRDLTLVVAEMGRELRDLRAAIMRARMVSVAELLERIPLIVRGLAQATGKEVRVRIDAGRAELDKAVAERVFPAIVHLVRNAVDHGIELPAERMKAGKPAEGTIQVTCAAHSDTRLELEIGDDGRGVDAAAVALRAGRPAPRDAAELLELIALPGLSTRAEASTTSGRGVGMDIVKRIVDGLGGELLLRSEPGQGTTFTLRVPLSVSILDVLSFECAGQPFVVPMATVEEIVELGPEDVVKSPTPEGRAASAARGDGVRLVRRRGQVVPVIDLRALFELPASTARARTKALVVRRRAEPYAFEVDRMLGQQEVVIRSLDDPLVRVPGVTGTTDLGDGRATLVLDLVALAGSGQAALAGADA